MSRYELIEKKKPSWLVPTIIALLLIIGIASAFIILWPGEKTETKTDTGDQFIEILKVPSVEETLENDQVPAANTQGAASKQPSEKQSQQELVELPPLDKSDTLFREDLTRLSAGLSTWLGIDNLIRKLMVITNDFSQGMRVYKHFRFFKLEKAFIAKEDARGLYIPEEGYQRYDQLAAAVNAMDVGQSVALYKKYTPLFQQVFAEFGYPESHKLDDIFKKAAAEILAAPIIKGRISLIHPTVRYKFANPKLESLNPVQKQMLRMGPENTRIIQNKLRLIVEAMANMD